MIDIDKPLVTVTVPAYNHEAWVEETILSIVNQTYGYENIQLIVTDDCSKDNTPFILKKLADKYNFELILNKQNKGICLTINKMIELAKGKYIAGIASDDIMTLDRIEKQIDILVKNPEIDILAGSSILIDKNGKEIKSKSRKHDSSLTRYSFEDLFLKKKPGFPAGSAIIKKDLFKRIGTYDPKYKIEDYYFWLKAAYNSANISVCDYPFFYYRLHSSSISSNTKLMENELHKILGIYKKHPKYNKAIKIRKIDNLLKTGLNSKSKALKQIIVNPSIIFYKKTIKILILIILPKLFVKQKFFEKNYRINNTTL